MTAIVIAFLAVVCGSKLDVTPQGDIVVGDPVHVRVGGVEPGDRVTLVLELIDDRGRPYRSENAFIADANGVVDIATSEPSRGTYDGVDPLGVFWSMERTAEISACGIGLRTDPRIGHGHRRALTESANAMVTLVRETRKATPASVTAHP